MVKYGTRHHAHGGCLIDNKGFSFLEQLHPWQIRSIPWLTFKNRDVTYEQVRDIIAKAEGGK
jgi:hypothetical protein